MSQAAFSAVADPRRRAIMRMLRDQPLSVNEIAAGSGVTQQAISLHLKVLREAGLVAVRSQGQRHIYAVRPEGLTALREFLAEFWPEQLQQLKRAVENHDGD